MPVLMMVEIPGADAAFAEGMRHAGVLDELETAWRAARADPAYREELYALLKDYAARPPPLSDVPPLAQALRVRARLLLKREDLPQTAAHKRNNPIFAPVVTDHHKQTGCLCISAVSL